jgi:hypothetical protein
VSDLPKVLPQAAVDHWWGQIEHFAQRDGMEPMPMTCIGFYSNEAGSTVSIVIILAYWKECKVLMSLPDRRSDTGMTPFEKVRSVGFAIQLIQDLVKGGTVTVVVYVRDVTIGCQYALSNVSYINKRRGQVIGNDYADEEEDEVH